MRSVPRRGGLTSEIYACFLILGREQPQPQPQPKRVKCLLPSPCLPLAFAHSLLTSIGAFLRSGSGSGSGSGKEKGKAQQRTKSMADLERSPSSRWGESLLLRAMSKRRTWVALFLLVYVILLSSSWNLLLSIRSWYNSAVSSASSAASAGWPALYASVLYGGVFGLLSMGAALAVAVPATMVTWITILVLLAFAGKPRRTLVAEGRRITADITGFAFKILLREGNVVAAVGAALSFLALLLRRRRGGGEEQDV